MANDTFIPFGNVDLAMPLDYVPETGCFNWCIEQQVVHSNNLELYAVMLVVAAYTLLNLYSMDEIPLLAKYKDGFVYMAKLMLVVFFVMYILVIRLRIIY